MTPEQVLRDEWGRLLALLVAQFRRLDLAEDGLADAFERAVRVWGTDGAPGNPAAWLLTAARNRIIDQLRAEAVHARTMALLAVDAALVERAGEDEELDERLRLMLLCAHPLLPRESAAVLMLRLVLGVRTEEIARLFLVPTPTVAARLTRAKRRLTGASFEIPDDLGDRVGIVAEAAYLAFTAGYAPGDGPDLLRAPLAGEAIRLVRLLRAVLPAPDPEVDALLALMLVQHSRRDARTVNGRLVPLPEQDRSRWHHAEVAEAVALLAPFTHAPPAPFLLQALIAVEHAIAPSAGATAWDRIVARYDELLSIQDSPVVRLNRAVAVAECDGPAAGLAALDGLALPGHRLPAARAELLARLGDRGEALVFYDHAITLCRNEVERAYLSARRASL